MNKRSRTYTALAAVILLTGAVSALADGGNNKNETRLRTRLTGAAIQGKTPEGHADFRSDTRRTRLNVEVEEVNLPDGTVLTASLMHAGVSTSLGSITLSAGLGELELNSEDGDAVPAVQSGDMVTVSNAGKMILAGVF
jgi:hypothetical protein